MEVPRLEADAPVDAVEAALRDAGCAVVERLVPDELVDGIESELAPFLAATEPGGDEFTGFRTRRTGALLARSRGSATSPRTRWCSGCSTGSSATTQPATSCTSPR